VVDQSPLLFVPFHGLIVEILSHAINSTENLNDIKDFYFQNLVNAQFNGRETFECIQQLKIVPKIVTLFDYYEYLLQIPMIHNLLTLQFALDKEILLFHIVLSIQAYQEVCVSKAMYCNEDNFNSYCLPCHQDVPEFRTRSIGPENQCQNMADNKEEMQPDLVSEQPTLESRQESRLQSTYKSNDGQRKRQEVKQLWKNGFMNCTNQFSSGRETRIY
jgi:hypothetical protein